MYSESSTKTPIKDLVKSDITPQLRSKFQQIGPALMTAHGKDIQHQAGQEPSWKPATVYSKSSISSHTDDAKTASTASTSTAGHRAVNVTSLSDQQEFRCDAATLYQIFTDPQRIAAFTRSPPKVFEGARAGGKFELFGGNVSGEYTELTEPTAIEQKWRLAQWPQGHFSTLRLKFEQNNVDAVTIMRADWTGIPVGQEEAAQRNWAEYYVRYDMRPSSPTYVFIAKLEPTGASKLPLASARFFKLHHVKTIKISESCHVQERKAWRTA